MVTVKVNGQKEVVDVAIKEEVVDPKISKCFRTWFLLRQTTPSKVDDMTNETIYKRNEHTGFISRGINKHAVS